MAGGVGGCEEGLDVRVVGWEALSEVGGFGGGEESVGCKGVVEVCGAS